MVSCFKILRLNLFWNNNLFSNLFIPKLLDKIKLHFSSRLFTNYIIGGGCAAIIVHGIICTISIFLIQFLCAHNMRFYRTYIIVSQSNIILNNSQLNWEINSASLKFFILFFGFLSSNTMFQTSFVFAINYSPKLPKILWTPILMINVQISLKVFHCILPKT